MDLPLISLLRQILRPSFGPATLVLVCVVSVCLAQADRELNPAPRDALRSFLQHHLKQRDGGVDKTTRYLYAFVDLDGRGKRDAVVYVTGQSWCGSGGCTVLVLTPEASSYRVVSKILIARPPILLLAARSNGWRDLGVWVQGGGIRRGHEYGLPFDGKGYPTNPSVPPARQLEGEGAGEVVLAPSEEGALLYP